MQLLTRPVRQKLLLVACLGALTATVRADAPPGWITDGSVSAYTTPRGQIDLALSALRVNDTLDFLDIRDELLSGTRQLVGNSGDLKGYQLEAHYGVTDWLSLFYLHRQQDLTVDLGEISSVNVLDLDRSLSTTSQTAGLKWTLYVSSMLADISEQTALALEVSYARNRSDNFDLVTDQVRSGGLTITFPQAQTFSVNALEDSGWHARLIGTRPLTRAVTGSAWVGFRDSEAEAGTGSDLDDAAIAPLFEQFFRLDERFATAGLGLDVRLSPRLPLTVNYEYLKAQSSRFERDSQSDSVLPSFLTGSAPVAGENHTVSARLSYWLTPRVYASLSGHYYSNHLTGVIPHYNNPLSGGFADKSYGFAGFSLGLKF